jgi:hypothetical protein
MAIKTWPGNSMYDPFYSFGSLQPGESRNSFRESEEQLRGCSGLVAIDHSTLSKKVSRVPFKGFQDLFHLLVKRCPRRIRCMFSLPFFVFAVDSTIITMGKKRLPWAYFRESRTG